MKLLVIDIETTGLDIASDSIVEIGAALVDTTTKQIDIVFNKIVKDKYWDRKKHKDAWIFETSDLTLEDVEEADFFDKHLEELQELIEKYDTVAFNLKFDERFLTRDGIVFNKSKCLMEAVKNYVVFENKNGRNVKPSVEEIYNHFLVDKNKEPYVEKHRAASDAFDEAKIMLHMIGLKADKNYVKKVAKKTQKVKPKPKYKIKKTYDVVDVGSEFPFGKHKGTIFSEVVKKDKRYVKWCLENVGGLSLTDDARKLVEQ